MAGDPSPAKRSHENEKEKETAQNPTKRPRYNYNDTISVLVGPEEQSFTVHKDVVCSSSKFFKAACSESWKEGQEGIVRLPTVKPSVFEMYMDWIYFSEIASKVTGWLMGPLIELYLLGEMLDDKYLRNKVMEALQVNAHKTHTNPSPRKICHIWQNTTEGSMLRKWAFDRVLLRHGRAFEENVAKYPPEFIQQIAVKLMHQTSHTSATEFLAKTHEYQEAGEEA